MDSDRWIDRLVKIQVVTLRWTGSMTSFAIGTSRFAYR